MAVDKYLPSTFCGNYKHYAYTNPFNPFGCYLAARGYRFKDDYPVVSIGSGVTHRGVWCDTLRLVWVEG